MTSRSIDAEPTPIGVVLGDANVLYSRVLRDYLLYAMTQRLIRVRWSNEILAEVVKHLAANLEGFDQTSGRFPLNSSGYDIALIRESPKRSQLVSDGFAHLMAH